MKLIKLMTKGYPQGIWAITDKQEVTDAILDKIQEDKNIESKNESKNVLKFHLESEGLCFVPKNEKAFDWDENIHGVFFN